MIIKGTESQPSTAGTKARDGASEDVTGGPLE